MIFNTAFNASRARLETSPDLLRNSSPSIQARSPPDPYMEPKSKRRQVQPYLLGSGERLHMHGVSESITPLRASPGGAARLEIKRCKTRTILASAHFVVCISFAALRYEPNAKARLLPDSARHLQGTVFTWLFSTMCRLSCRCRDRCLVSCCRWLLLVCYAFVSVSMECAEW
jgi:hypothetical protein